LHHEEWKKHEGFNALDIGLEPIGSREKLLYMQASTNFILLNLLQSQSIPKRRQLKVIVLKDE
jgi:hypothetical protein